MNFETYIKTLPTKKKISAVKLKILKRLWGKESEPFPKPWVSSAELLELTGQKYFDRRTRELRDQLGCDLESSYIEKFSGHGWRIVSSKLATPQDRDYLTQTQKNKLFESFEYCCATCGLKTPAGVRGLQADHKVPLSRGGGNEIGNWQPLCNNCNVSKRRACDGCLLLCKECSWAFPEITGVKSIFNINVSTLRRVETFSKKRGISRDKVIEDAAEYYLDNKDKN